MNKPLILATNIDQLEKGQKASRFRNIRWCFTD